MSRLEENEALCECIKCHKVFSFVKRKKIKRDDGRIDIVSPCCEDNLNIYYDNKTELFFKEKASLREKYN